MLNVFVAYLFICSILTNTSVECLLCALEGIKETRQPLPSRTSMVTRAAGHLQKQTRPSDLCCYGVFFFFFLSGLHQSEFFLLQFLEVSYFGKHREDGQELGNMLISGPTPAAPPGQFTNCLDQKWLCHCSFVVTSHPQECR